MGLYGGLKNIGRVLFPPDFQFDLRLVGDGGLEPPTPAWKADALPAELPLLAKLKSLLDQ